ncbi:hypothetical protein MFLAVUS_007067 [Mucor flavus]|uniref:Uncharacterized protein n=1 Tax=Mucor flavus TaxID=439312 RepID=A0ABP9Z3A1_9FUNG
MLRLAEKLKTQSSLGDTNGGLKCFINDLLDNDVPSLKEYKADCQFINNDRSKLRSDTDEVYAQLCK